MMTIARARTRHVHAHLVLVVALHHVGVQRARRQRAAQAAAAQQAAARPRRERPAAKEVIEQPARVQACADATASVRSARTQRASGGANDTRAMRCAE